MASYRGIDQEDIAKTMTTGLGYLTSAPLGLKTLSMLVRCFSNVSTLELLTAPDDATLTGLIRRKVDGGPSLRSVFAPFKELIQDQACLEKVNGTADGDNAALTVLRGLSSWSAFDCPEPIFQREEIDREIDTLLISQGLDRLQAVELGLAPIPSSQDGPTYTRIKLNKMLGSVSGEFRKAAQGLRGLLSELTTLRAVGAARDIDDFIQQTSPGNRMLLKSSLSAMTGLADVAQITELPSAFALYGVRAQMSGRRNGLSRRETKSLVRRSAIGLLSPFGALDEVVHLEERSLPDWVPGRAIHYFYGTARAAQAIADGMPDAAIVRFTKNQANEIIKPRGNIPPVKPSPGPA